MLEAHRTKLRGAVIGACTAALVAGAGLLTLPAQAHSQQEQAVPAAGTLMTSRAEQQVASFFQEYQDAVKGQHSEGSSPAEVRQAFLTTELDDALTAWGSEHQADPVFRAQNLPATWSTTDTDSTDTHTKIIVTENWEDGTSTGVWYQVRLSDLKIDSLTDPTA
ncbi:hypothetical protein ACFVX6_15690 [Streptomyces sp. NPDC058289]|uniref:hypothetical protein n=1 Tax=Streptomyces sp. NPDC058289 TaxID=3346425 RepID=UPI0036E94EE3